MCEGVYGHTAVYHSLTAAVYVYGGYEFTAQRAAFSNSLFSLLLIVYEGMYSGRWNRIMSADSSQVFTCCDCFTNCFTNATRATCQLLVSENGPNPFPGHMLYKVTKPDSILCAILMLF